MIAFLFRDVYIILIEDSCYYQRTMMPKVYFISDAHLGSGEPFDKEIETSFLKFLYFVQKKGDALYIVGDLFDFWFEYHSVIPRKYFRVLCALNSLVENGMDVSIMTGNHDFGMDRFFEDELRIHIYKEPLELKLGNRRLYISHGDGLAKKDRSYRLLKKIIRNPVNIFFYRLLHPDIGFALATCFSRTSRNFRELKDADEDYIRFARNRFSKGFDFVILGHTHLPLEYREGKKTYINTGDWINHFTYAKLEKDHLSLEYWGKK